jgi:hypothetical protein
MKKLVLILAVLALYSCTESNVVRQQTGYVIRDAYAPLEVIIVDSCEYLYGGWGHATVLTHKGNCKNHK